MEWLGGSDEGTRRVSNEGRDKDREAKNVPLEPQRDPVNDPDNSRDENSGGSSVPASEKVDLGSVSAKKRARRGGRRERNAHQRAVAKKHMVDPLYIGSVWTLKGKPVTVSVCSKETRV